MKIEKRLEMGQTLHNPPSQVQTASETLHSPISTESAGSNVVTRTMAEKVRDIVAELDNWKTGSNKKYAERLQYLFRHFVDREHWRNANKKEVMLLTHMIIGKEMEGEELLDAARLVLGG